MILYTTKEGLPDNLVFSITQDNQGTIWAGTSKGLAKLENGRFITVGLDSNLPNNFVMCTYAGRDGTLMDRQPRRAPSFRRQTLRNLQHPKRPH